MAREVKGLVTNRLEPGPDRARGGREAGAVLDLHLLARRARCRLVSACGRPEERVACVLGPYPAGLADGVLRARTCDRRVCLGLRVQIVALRVVHLEGRRVALRADSARRVARGVADARVVLAREAGGTGLEARVRPRCAIGEHELPRRALGARQADRILRRGARSGRVVACAADGAGHAYCLLRAAARDAGVVARAAREAGPADRVSRTAEIPAAGLGVVRTGRRAGRAVGAHSIGRVNTDDSVVSDRVLPVARRAGRALRVLRTGASARLVQAAPAQRAQQALARPIGSAAVQIIARRAGLAGRAHAIGYGAHAG